MAAERWSELLESAATVHEAEDYGEATRLAGEAYRRLAAERGPEAAGHMARLLGNEVHGAKTRRLYKCPRCEVTPMQWVEGKDDPEFAAQSRVSRDEDDAPVSICSDCGEREAMAGLRPPEEWPLSIADLLAEDRARYTMGRASRVEYRTIDELEGGEGD